MSQFNSRTPAALTEPLHTFLKPEIFQSAMVEIRENTSSEAAFRKRFFRWINGFQAMKFLHHARDRFYGRKEVAEEARRLLILRSNGPLGDLSVRELLSIYRKLDREQQPRE